MTRLKEIKLKHSSPWQQETSITQDAIYYKCVYIVFMVIPLPPCIFDV